MIRPLQIGSVTLPNNLILAPMAGVTDLPFRIITEKFEPGLVCTEMVSSKALFFGDEKTKKLLKRDEETVPVSMQIFGSDPETMGFAAQYVSKLADIVDINMGCPAPKVVKNGDGSKLLLDLEKAKRIMKVVVENSSVPVTVKIRKGWDKENIIAVQVAKIAEEVGISAITIHGRTRSEFYTGKADWDIIKEVKDSVKIPVIGNGDIVDEETAYQMFEKTGVDGIMIGRGSFGNPWIFRNIKHFLITGEKLPSPTNSERLNIIKNVLDIKNIKINDKDVNFNRNLDYFEINNTQNYEIDTITINYDGYSSRYYSNIQGTILPGFLPFYPMAGYQEVYDLNYQSFVPNHSDKNINFNVNVSSMKQFYSNLNESEKNHFSGNAESLSLVSGLYKSILVNDIKIIYPYLDIKEMNKNSIENYINKFKASNIDNNKIKTIIILPSLNQGKFETVYSNNNYMISRWIVDIQNDYIESLINKDKLELYYCIDAFENDNESYQETKKYFCFTALFEENLKEHDKNEFYEKCNHYLFDSNDKRTIEEFLEDLLEVK